MIISIKKPKQAKPAKEFTVFVVSDLEIKLLEQEIRRAKLPVIATPLTEEEDKAVE